MRKIIFLLCSVFLAQAAFSQFSVSAGMSYWITENKSFDRFRATYNARGVNTLVQPMGKFKPAIGPKVDIGYGFSIFDIRFGAFPYNTTTSAIFRNGESRTLQLKATMLEGSFGFRLPSDKWYAGLYVGFEQNIQRNSRLYSYYTYKDGTVSYTSEKFINDAFNDNFTTISFGLRGAIGIRKIKLFGTAERFGQMGSPSHTELKDDLNRWSTTGHHLMTSYLLQDYGTANNDIIANSGINDNVFKTFNGWRFSAGIEVWPFRKKS